MWSPGHADIPGNEAADSVAKLGASGRNFQDFKVIPSCREHKHERPYRSLTLNNERLANDNNDNNYRRITGHTRQRNALFGPTIASQPLFSLPAFDVASGAVT